MPIFAPFILKNEANEFMNTLIRSSFQQFFEKNIHIYPNYKTLQVHFVGSIAFRFKKYLEMLAQTNAFSLKNVIPRPIEKLMEYHAFH